MSAPSRLTVVRLKPRALISIDSLKEVPESTCAAIELWQHPAEFWDLPSEEKLRVQALSMAWQMAMHWFIRLEFYSTARKKYLIPGPRNLRKVIETQGVFLQSLFKLCERIHTFEGGKPTLPYKNASMFFVEVAKEIRHWQLMVAYSPSFEPGHSLTKEEAVAPLRATYQDLQNLKNPFDPGLQPHEYRLIDGAHSLVRQYPDFKSKYWKPFLDSFSKWIRAQNRDSAFKACNKTTDSKGKSRLSINPSQGTASILMN